MQQSNQIRFDHHPNRYYHPVCTLFHHLSVLLSKSGSVKIFDNTFLDMEMLKCSWLLFIYFHPIQVVQPIVFDFIVSIPLKMTIGIEMSLFQFFSHIERSYLFVFVNNRISYLHQQRKLYFSIWISSKFTFTSPSIPEIPSSSPSISFSFIML